MSPQDDIQKMIERAQAGDRGAFEGLVEKYRERLLERIRLRLGKGLQGRVEAEDVLQETLLRAFLSVGRFRWQGDASFPRWLGGIAENLLLDLADQQSRKGFLRLEREVRMSGTSPSVALRRKERFSRLEDALNKLSPEHRQVILLARIEGVPVKEIALRMNRTPNAVAQLLWRALRRLRETFGDTESLHLPDGTLEIEGEEK